MSRVIDPERAPVSGQLGQRIRAARKDASMSQGQLANALNTTQSAISLYEAGQRSVGIDMLLAVARILNRPLHYFLGEEGDMLYVRDSDIAQLISELEKHPEDLPELLAYWQFLRWRRLAPTTGLSPNGARAGSNGHH